LPDAQMQAIAAENNLAETAFFVPDGDRYRLRWFTPAVEVDLCGHATLASAHVIFERLAPARQEVSFTTLTAGTLTVRREGSRLALELPARPAVSTPAPPGLAVALGRAPVEVQAARDHLCVFDRAEDVAGLAPDFAALSQVECWGVIATAPGKDGVDFVSRFFAPRQGVAEDPATGSSHCTLVPYWAARLGTTRLEARQLSRRGGAFTCLLTGDRVTLIGGAVLYFEGSITL
ncbi:MAG TPA: PhzF family phenazine biosynthesis protein, partial [Stellaceae bacterium]|nr:PhzF family phenazine biosynthesis protein [Stellaceae bacterium]